MPLKPTDCEPLTSSISKSTSWKWPTQTLSSTRLTSSMPKSARQRVALASSSVNLMKESLSRCFFLADSHQYKSQQHFLWYLMPWKYITFYKHRSFNKGFIDIMNDNLSWMMNVYYLLTSICSNQKMQPKLRSFLQSRLLRKYCFFLFFWNQIRK